MKLNIIALTASVALISFAVPAFADDCKGLTPAECSSAMLEKAERPPVEVDLNTGEQRCFPVEVSDPGDIAFYDGDQGGRAHQPVGVRRVDEIAWTKNGIGMLCAPATFFAERDSFSACLISGQAAGGCIRVSQPAHMATIRRMSITNLNHALRMGGR